MEQLQQLIEILKQTPSMALWGIGMFLGWRLLTLASWVSALAFTAKLFINKYFDHANNRIANSVEDQERLAEKELRIIKAKAFYRYVDESTYADTSGLQGLFNAISAMTGVRGSKLHDSDIREATKAIEKLIK